MVDNIRFGKPGCCPRGLHGPFGGPTKHLIVGTNILAWSASITTKRLGADIVFGTELYARRGPIGTPFPRSRLNHGLNCITAPPPCSGIDWLGAHWGLTYAVPTNKTWLRGLN